MPRDDNSSFRVRPGKPRFRNGRDEQLSLSFSQQVTRAVAKQGGDPRRLVGYRGANNSSGTRGKDAGKEFRSNGRFNARGRGREAAANLPRENAWSAPECGMRFQARRVVVKARVVKTSMHKRGLTAWVEREGVMRLGDDVTVFIPQQRIFPHGL